LHITQKLLVGASNLPGRSNSIFGGSGFDESQETMSNNKDKWTTTSPRTDNLYKDIGEIAFWDFYKYSRRIGA